MASIKGTSIVKTPANESALEQWAKNLIQKWEKEIESLGTQGTGDLVRSFRFRVEWESSVVAGDTVDFLRRVHFTFNHYGKMLDYGLGRGLPARLRFLPGASPADFQRQRKQWIAAPFVEYRKVISRLLAKQNAVYANEITKAMYLNTLNANTVIKL